MISIYFTINQFGLKEVLFPLKWSMEISTLGIILSLIFRCSVFLRAVYINFYQ